MSFRLFCELACVHSLEIPSGLANKRTDRDIHMRPNILLITADQHRGDCFGFEDRRVKTPHFDGLARQGARFSACITPNLVCMPARASLLTGLLPLTHGVRDNGIDLPEAMGGVGFAAQLSRAGYHTRFIGKAHFSVQDPFDDVAPTGRPECAASTKDYGADWTGPYMGFDTVELVCPGHDIFGLLKPPYGLHYEAWFHADGQGEEKLGIYKRLSPSQERPTLPFHSLLPPAWHPSSWVADRTIEFLGQHRDRPFCPVGVVPRSALPFRRPRALEPAAPTRRGGRPPPLDPGPRTAPALAPAVDADEVRLAGRDL